MVISQVRLNHWWREKAGQWAPNRITGSPGPGRELQGPDSPHWQGEALAHHWQQQQCIRCWEVWPGRGYSGRGLFSLGRKARILNSSLDRLAVFNSVKCLPDLCPPGANIFPIVKAPNLQILPNVRSIEDQWFIPILTICLILISSFYFSVLRDLHCRVWITVLATHVRNLIRSSSEMKGNHFYWGPIIGKALCSSTYFLVQSAP